MRRFIAIFTLYLALGLTAVLLDWKSCIHGIHANFLWMHTGLSITALISAQLYFNLRRKRFIFFLALALILLPIVSAIMLVAIQTTLFTTRKMDLLGGYHEEDKTIAESLDVLKLEENDDAAQDTMNVEPLVETIRSCSSTELKRGAIETLTQIANPQSVSLLKECLVDPDPEVRFYASSGLSRIEERMNERIIRLKHRLQDGEDNLSLRSDLGRAYFEFIYMEIQDRASLSYYLTQAIDNFEIAAQYPSADDSIHHYLQRAYTAASRYDDAKKVHDSHFKDRLESTSNIMYLAENFFAQGLYRECLNVLKQARSSVRAAKVVRDVQSLWLEADAERLQ